MFSNKKSEGFNHWKNYNWRKKNVTMLIGTQVPFYLQYKEKSKSGKK